MGKILNNAKPRTRKVVEQGYGWVRVQRVVSMPVFKHESEVPNDPSKMPDTEIEEGYVRAKVKPNKTQAEYDLDGKSKAVPVSKLYAERPRNLGLLLDSNDGDGRHPTD